MNFVRWITLVLAVSMVSLTGCQPAEEGGDNNATSAAAGSDTDTSTVSTPVLCGTCGHEKGTESCCAEGAETCECGMHKGSALCCVSLSEDAAGKDICSGCGHVADAGHACDTDCEKCADCGLHAGSPLCCKLTS